MERGDGIESDFMMVKGFLREWYLSRDLKDKKKDSYMKDVMDKE